MSRPVNPHQVRRAAGAATPSGSLAFSHLRRCTRSKRKAPGAETIVQKDSHEAEFERMSDEELIKAIEERANKLGIKINLRYDFGSGRSDDAQ